jgi:hypothetical protein
MGSSKFEGSLIIIIRWDWNSEREKGLDELEKEREDLMKDALKSNRNGDVYRKNMLSLERKKPKQSLFVCFLPIKESNPPPLMYKVASFFSFFLLLTFPTFALNIFF